MTVEEFWNATGCIAVHCSTKEKYDRFIKRLIEVTDSDWGFDPWEDCYGEETCITTEGLTAKESIIKQFKYKIIEFEELKDFWTRDTFTNNKEIQAMIDKAIDNPMGLKVFVNEFAKMILIPELNTDFSFSSLKDTDEFKCELLYKLSTYANDDNPDIWRYGYGKDNRLEDFINYMLDTSFTKEDFEIIYSKFGKGINYTSCLDFIKSNCDISLLKKVWHF